MTAPIITAHCWPGRRPEKGVDMRILITGGGGFVGSHLHRLDGRFDRPIPRDQDDGEVEVPLAHRLEESQAVHSGSDPERPRPGAPFLAKPVQ